MSNPNFAPESVHLPALQKSPRRSAYNGGDFLEWQTATREKLIHLLGTNPAPCDLAIRIEYDRVIDGFRERRIVFTAEPGAEVPCLLVTPLESPSPPPLMICVQGHTPGMHLSVGRWTTEVDRYWAVDMQQDFALQALANGFAALAIEQRGFGERADQRSAEANPMGKGCHHMAMNALLLGRTTIGERGYDVSRAIDMIEQLGTAADVDTDRIGIVGCSGGGTTALFATCIEPRIKAAMVIAYLCTFEGCMGTLDHCACNYVPGVGVEFDMPDIAGLIAPAPLVVVSGDEDPIFPVEAVRKAYRAVEQLYAASEEPNNCRLIIGHGGHRAFAEASWPVFRELTEW